MAKVPVHCSASHRGLPTIFLRDRSIEFFRKLKIIKYLGTQFPLNLEFAHVGSELP